MSCRQSYFVIAKLLMAYLLNCILDFEIQVKHNAACNFGISCMACWHVIEANICKHCEKNLLEKCSYKFLLFLAIPHSYKRFDSIQNTQLNIATSIFASNFVQWIANLLQCPCRSNHITSKQGPLFILVFIICFCKKRLAMLSL